MLIKSQAANCHLRRIYVIASGKFGTAVNTGLLTYLSLCLAELFKFCWVECVYGFGVGIGCWVKVKFWSDRNTSYVMWGTFQGVLRGFTGLGMIVCCCNVTVTADGLKLKHHAMRTVCGKGRKLVALKVCVTGLHILGWQKSSNSCVSADRSVNRSLPQWGKQYLTTHHTRNMENNGNHKIAQLVHTNKIVPDN
jgi:hypothetical protein